MSDGMEQGTFNSQAVWTVEGMLESLQKLKPGPGEIDLYCHATFDEVILSTSFALLGRFARWSDGKVMFSRTLLLLPPRHASEVEVFRKGVMDSARGFLESRVPAQELPRLLALLDRGFQVSVLESWEIEHLVECVRTCAPGSAILVLSAAHLYSPRVGLPPAHVAAKRSPIGKVLHVRMFEDTWVPRLVYAVEQLVPVAKSRSLYLVLWAGELAPTRVEHRERLDLLPIGRSWTESGQGLAEVADQALGLAREGRLEEALRICDGAAFSLDSRVLLKAKCWELAGQGPLAYGQLEPFRARLLEKATASQVIEIARWALLAGRYDEGRELLERALASPEVNESFFDMALATAELARDDALVARVLEGLRRYFPRSRALWVHEARVHFIAGRHAEVVQRLAPLIEQGEEGSEVWVMWLIARHHQMGPLDYERLMREVHEHSPSLRDAVAEYWFSQALDRDESPELILERAFEHSWSKGATSDAIGTLLLGAERLLLAPASRSEERRLGLLWRVLERTLDYLSTHPGDDRRRRQLVRLLDPSLSGKVLFELLHYFALSAWPWWEGTRPAIRPEVKHMAQEHLPAVIDIAMRASPRFMVAGQGNVPVDALPCPPEEVLAFFFWFLQNAAAGLTPGEEGMKQLLPVLHVALLFARLVGEPDDDIRVRGMAAGALGVGGDFRTARDLMETMLVGISPSDSSQRRRLAWIAFADFCVRAHALPEALLALACANRCPPGRELEEDVFHECRLWIRLLRDLHHLEHALTLLSRARSFLHRTGQEEHNRHHLDQLETGIRCTLLFQELEATESGVAPETRARFLELCEMIADANRRARATDGEFQPGLLLLGQLLAIGTRYGLRAPERIQREFEELLPDTGPLYEPLIKATAERISGTSVLGGFSWGLEKLREPGEIGSIIQLHEMLARRDLAAAVDGGRAADALYLLEWSMDRSLRNVDEAGLKKGPALRLTQDVFEWVGRSIHGPGGERGPEQLARMGNELGQLLEEERTRRLPRQPPPAAECERFVIELSRRGVPIHVLGLDERQALIRVSAVEGRLSVVREEAGVFDREAFHAWKKGGYPAGYAAMDLGSPHGVAEVERTLVRLGVSAEPSPTALFVPTMELQPLPPNLLLVGGELAGRRMAVASVPSLTWLRAAHATPRERTARRGAWIPTADAPEEHGILTALRDDLQGALHAHGLELSCEARPAKALAGADVVLIGAHGALSGEGLFFRVVADERSSRLSARDLALAVSGAGVVILAICNGTRVDQSPFARATVGLARLLLEHGCRTVLGSPWNLEISVLRRWVPVFLKCFDAGATVLEANHAANQAVAERFSRHPAHSLAMNLLGDPFVTR